MTRPPTYYATDTEFTVSSARFPEEHPRLWKALNEWCRFHDIDPRGVPMITTIRRNVAACRVEYEQLALDDQGRLLEGPNIIRRAVSQGEAPPLPFPVLIHDHDCSLHSCWRPGCCNPRRPDCTPETT
jgi:hypothetical protein